VRIKYKKIKKNRNMVMNQLKNKGIITQVHYIPITNHPFFKKFINKNDNLDNAKSYYEEALSLPLYYSLNEREQEKVISELKKIVG
jgi:dTDP-4-amino-4,6-dideoxygalactose transaminase